jgi:hypothetical protein
MITRSLEYVIKIWKFNFQQLGYLLNINTQLVDYCYLDPNSTKYMGQKVIIDQYKSLPYKKVIIKYQMVITIIPIINQHPLVHHERWMVSGYERSFYWISVS